MPDLLVQSFTPLLQAFPSCFTQPSFCSFWDLVCAWILCSGRRSLTRVIQSAPLSPFKSYCSFHRFFSQARWNPEELGHGVFRLLLPFCPPVLVGAVDDPLARKSGRHLWGADMHHDPLCSTRTRPFFAFGHRWVVFSLHVCFPFAPQKYWALPILVRLYRQRRKDRWAPGRHGQREKKPTGQAADKEYRTRPPLALGMIQKVAGGVPNRTLRVLGDSEYAGRSVSRQLPRNVHLISRMTMNAALYEVPPQLPGRRGRRRKKGKRLPRPLHMAEDRPSPWIKATLRLYGKRVRVWYKHVDALWYSSAGQRLLRIVVVRDPARRRHDDGFFSTDPTLPPPEILTTFSLRWPLEVCFRDVERFLGFEDPQSRVSHAAQRTAPLVFYIYDLGVIWYAPSGYQLAPQSTLQRFWYKQKNSTSFEDLLRTLRWATWQERAFADPALDRATQKILQPLVEWAKGVA